MRVEITSAPHNPIIGAWPPAMARHLELSTMSWIGRANGEVVCIWGLIPPSYLSDEAYLWLNVTPEMAKHQFVFVRHSQCEMERMLEIYSRIVGFVDVGNTRAKRWLRWLGAEFDEPGGERVHFVIERKSWQK